MNLLIRIPDLIHSLYLYTGYKPNQNSMKRSKSTSLSAAIVGASIAGLGLIFMAQSRAEIGPQSSFMYNNPDWTLNGFVIAIVGIVVAIAGIGWHLLTIKHNQSSKI
jgi:hypothetical protein